MITLITVRCWRALCSDNSSKLMPAFIIFLEIKLSISICSWRKRKQRITKGYSRLSLAYQEETRDAQALIYDHACDLSGMTWRRRRKLHSTIKCPGVAGTVTQVQGNSLLLRYTGQMPQVCSRLPHQRPPLALWLHHTYKTEITSRNWQFFILLTYRRHNGLCYWKRDNKTV